MKEGDIGMAKEVFFLVEEAVEGSGEVMVGCRIHDNTAMEGQVFL